MRFSRRLAIVIGGVAILSAILGTVVANDRIGLISNGPTGPLASFTYNPCVMCAAPGDVVFFNASYSISPFADIVSYAWNFGDGSPLYVTNSSSATHMYGGLTSKWQVTLTVEDSNHQTDTISQLVNFNIAPRFTFQPASPETGQKVTFNASSTIIYFQNPAPPGFFWNFGDGSNATGAVVVHVYNTVGVNRITLSVVTTGGNATISKTIMIRQDPPAGGGGGGGSRAEVE